MLASDGLTFQFATDGEGNYGYLGADDSFIPFKSNVEVLAKAGRLTSSSGGSYITLHTTTKKYKEIYLITNALQTTANSDYQPISTHSGGEQIMKAFCKDDDGMSWLHVTKYTNVAAKTAIKAILYYMYSYIILGVS